jgi:hypothetical protein
LALFASLDIAVNYNYTLPSFVCCENLCKQGGVMTIREIIDAELDKIDDAYLAELYEVIQQFAQSRQPTKKPTLMYKLRSIQIDGPLDLATNLNECALPAIHV